MFHQISKRSSAPKGLSHPQELQNNNLPQTAVMFDPESWPKESNLSGNFLGASRATTEGYRIDVEEKFSRPKDRRGRFSPPPSGQGEQGDLCLEGPGVRNPITHLIFTAGEVPGRAGSSGVGCLMCPPPEAAQWLIIPLPPEMLAEVLKMFG